MPAQLALPPHLLAARRLLPTESEAASGGPLLGSPGAGGAAHRHCPNLT